MLDKFRIQKFYILNPGTFGLQNDGQKNYIGVGNGMSFEFLEEKLSTEFPITGSAQSYNFEYDLSKAQNLLDKFTDPKNQDSFSDLFTAEIGYSNQNQEAYQASFFSTVLAHAGDQSEDKSHDEFKGVCQAFQDQFVDDISASGLDNPRETARAVLQKKYGFTESFLNLNRSFVDHLEWKVKESENYKEYQAAKTGGARERKQSGSKNESEIPQSRVGAGTHEFSKPTRVKLEIADEENKQDLEDTSKQSSTETNELEAKKTEAQNFNPNLRSQTESTRQGSLSTTLREKITLPTKSKSPILTQTANKDTGEKEVNQSSQGSSQKETRTSPPEITPSVQAGLGSITTQESPLTQIVEIQTNGLQPQIQADIQSPQTPFKSSSDNLSGEAVDLELSARPSNKTPTSSIGNTSRQIGLGSGAISQSTPIEPKKITPDLVSQQSKQDSSFARISRPPARNSLPTADQSRNQTKLAAKPPKSTVAKPKLNSELTIPESSVTSGIELPKTTDTGSGITPENLLQQADLESLNNAIERPESLPEALNPQILDSIANEYLRQDLGLSEELMNNRSVELTALLAELYAMARRESLAKGAIDAFTGLEAIENLNQIISNYKGLNQLVDAEQAKDLVNRAYIMQAMEMANQNQLFSQTPPKAVVVPILGSTETTSEPEKSEEQLEKESYNELTDNSPINTLTPQELTDKGERFVMINGNPVILPKDPVPGFAGQKSGEIPLGKLSQRDIESLQDKMDEYNNKANQNNFDASLANNADTAQDLANQSIYNSQKAGDINQALSQDLANKNSWQNKLKNYSQKVIEEVKKKVVAFVAANVAPWIAGFLIAVILLTLVVVVVLIATCKGINQNILVKGALSISGNEAFVKMCDFLGSPIDGGSQAGCPAGYTAYRKNANGEWVEVSEAAGISGGLPVCLDKSIAGLSNNDTVTLWKGNAGKVSQGQVKVGAIRQVLQAASQAGVSSNTVAFVLSVCLTESNCNFKLYSPSNPNICYGIIQFCRAPSASCTYQIVDNWVETGRKPTGDSCNLPTYTDPNDLLNDPVRQMQMAEKGYELKVTELRNLPKLAGKSDIYKAAAGWLGIGCDNFGTCYYHYGEAAERNYAIITCSGSQTTTAYNQSDSKPLTDYSVRKPKDFSLVDYLKQTGESVLNFGSIKAEAQGSPGSFVYNGEDKQVLDLISQGKIVDSIVNASARGSLRSQIQQRLLQPNTLKSMVLIAQEMDKVGIKRFQVSSAYRSNSTSGHGRGEKIDIDILFGEGKIYPHTGASNGDPEGIEMWVKFAKIINSVESSQFIISGGSLADALLQEKQNGNLRIRILKDSGANISGDHSHHYDIGFDPNVEPTINGSGVSPSSSGLTGETICCPPGLTPESAIAGTPTPTESSDLTNVLSNNNLSGVSVMELGGSNVFNKNGGSETLPMSTIKIPIAATVIRQIQEGKLSLDQKINSFYGYDFTVQEALIKGIQGPVDTTYNQMANDLAFTVASANDNSLNKDNPKAIMDKFNSIMQGYGYGNTKFFGYADLVGTGATRSTTNDITAATNFVYSGSGGGFDIVKSAMQKAADPFNTGSTARKYGLGGGSNLYPSITGIYNINGKDYVITAIGGASGSTSNITNSITQTKSLIQEGKIIKSNQGKEVSFNNQAINDYNLAFSKNEKNTEANLSDILFGSVKVSAQESGCFFPSNVATNTASGIDTEYTGDPNSAGWGPVTKGTFTSTYGPRGGRKHKGIDIGAPTGTPIWAARSGVVTIPSYDASGYGNWLILTHDDGFTSRYGHLSKISVTNGQRVNKGQVIGLMGSTGLSTGPHLHFEVRLPGGGAYNPCKIDTYRSLSPACNPNIN